MRFTFEYDENGGYDCITPAFTVRDEAGRIVVDVDLRHFGWNETGQGSDIAERRERGRARALAITRMIVAAPIMRDALALIEELSCNASHGKLNPTSAIEPIYKAAGAALLQSRETHYPENA